MTEEQRRVSAGTITAIVIAALVLVFALQNSESANIKFLFFDFDAPLIFVIIGAALLGALVGAIMRRQGRRRG